LGIDEDGPVILTEELANIIRRCWQTDPEQRPTLSNVIKLLQEQLIVYQDEEEWI